MNTPNLIGRRFESGSNRGRYCLPRSPIDIPYTPVDRASPAASDLLRSTPPLYPFHLIMQFTKRASSPFSQAPGPPVEPGMCKHDGRAGL